MDISSEVAKKETSVKDEGLTFAVGFGTVVALITAIAIIMAVIRLLRKRHQPSKELEGGHLTGGGNGPPNPQPESPTAAATPNDEPHTPPSPPADNEEPQSIRCFQCNRVIKQRKNLPRHVRVLHNMIVPLIYCPFVDLCHKSFRNLDELKTHIDDVDHRHFPAYKDNRETCCCICRKKPLMVNAKAHVLNDH